MHGFRAYDGSRAPKGPFVLNKDSPQAEGLVGWWPAQEPGGLTFRDYSGFNNHAVGTARQGIVTRFGNRANDFAAAQDYAAPPPPANLLPNGIATLTMVFWAQHTAQVNNQQMFSLKQGTASSALLGIYPVDQTGGLGIRVFWNGTVIINQDDGTFADGLPHRFIFTARSATDHEAYVDGISVGTDSTSKTLTLPDEVGFGHWKGTQDAVYPGWDFRLLNQGVTSQEAFRFWDPSTRWDLYYELGRRTYFFAPAVSGVPSIGYPGGMMMGI